MWRLQANAYLGENGKLQKMGILSMDVKKKRPTRVKHLASM